MLRKICTIGNSCGVSIPKEILEKLQLTPGAQVDVKLDEKARNITIEPTSRKLPPKTVDNEFVSQVKDFISLYKPALRKLAE